MTAFVLPNLDESTIKELRKRFPNLSEIELPKLEIPKFEKVGKDVGKGADLALDRVLGRSSMPLWPWVVGSIGLAALIGAAAVWFTWFRRPSSMDSIVDEEISTWSGATDGSTDGSTAGTEYGGIGTESTSDMATGIGIESTDTALGGATDQALDRSTADAIGTFGDRPSDEYSTT